MKRKNILFLFIFLYNISIFANTQLHQKMMSAPDDALFSLMHYYKFYGDANTIHGNFFERSYVLGNLSGLRDRLVNHGIYLDTSLDLFFGFNTTGGANNDILRHNRLAEYWFTIDTAKNNLWPKGAFMLHAYTSWEFSVNDDIRSIVPANNSTIRPIKGKSISVLSEVAFQQVFNKYCTLRVGLLNVTGPLDDNNFASTSRNQFLNDGLVNNPIMTRFTPYSQLGFLGLFTANNLHTVKLFIGDINGTPSDKSKLRTFFKGKYTYCLQYQLTPTINQTLPGNYRLIVCVFNKKITRYNIDQRILCEQNITSIPINSQSINYALLLNFDQYIWVDTSVDSKKAHLQEEPPVGFGFFGRAGWAPQDRNTISQFYSFGIGGYGLPCTKRYYDFWGIGYTATGIAHNLRTNLEKQNINLRSFEYAFEAFYNFELGPSTHLQFDAQVIKPSLQSRNTAFVLQSRFRFDF